jgi:hypothetical protein
MKEPWVSRSVWKSALQFALVGPLVGLAIVLGLAVANVARLMILGHASEIAPPDGASAVILLEVLPFILVLFAAAFVVGAPGAFVAGAAMQWMLRHDLDCRRECLDRICGQLPDFLRV